MGSEADVDDLETALLERAQRLADEALSLGRQNQDRIIREENERLQLREEREVLLAKASAERNYRRRVQASELKVHEQLDQLRWSLTQSALERMRDSLRELVNDEKAYLPILKRLLKEAVTALEQPEVVAEFNERDRERVRGDWEVLCQEVIPGKRVLLSDQCHRDVGGVRVHGLDDSIQIDNTFEGRFERWERKLHETLIERLFGKAVEMDELVHG